MTRFEKELSGKLGEYWKRNAEREIAWMQERVDNGEVLLDGNCAAYWKSNGQYIPSDCVEKLQHTGFFFDADATNKAREQQDEEFFAAYRKNYRQPDAEMLAEIRAAFGNETVVDIVTGQVIC